MRHIAHHLSVRFLVLAVVIAASCSAHKKRVLSARQDGNHELAECFEGCEANNDACAASCERQFPTKWHHRHAGAAQPIIVAGKKVSGAVFAALHPLAISDARASGNEELATCFAACDRDDASCMNECESKHATREDSERRREMYLEAVELGLAAYQQDRKQHAKRKERWNRRRPDGATGSPPSTKPPSPKPSLDGPPKRAPGKSCGNATCTSNQKCVTYLKGSKLCAEGGVCSKVKKTHSVCRNK